MIVNASRGRSQERGEPRPARDFESFQRVLAADVIDRDDVGASRAASVLARVLGVHAGLVLVALRALRGREDVYCDGENTGLPLALLARALRLDVRLHVVLHRPEGLFQRVLLRRLRAGRSVASFLVFGPGVADRVRAQFDVPASRLHVLPIGVDTDYWRPAAGTGDAPDRPYICSAGLEYRDYPALIEAAAGLDVDVRVAAASPYSKRRNTLYDRALPSNVEAVDTDTSGLRALYSGAALVVVPLQDVEFTAGLTTVAEAMATGKCVVVSRSRGQAELVRDRRAALRGADGRPTAGGLVESLGIADDDLSGATGFYTVVGDSDDLSRALRYLLEHPDVREELGARARRVAVACLDHDVVAERLAAVMAATRAQVPPRAS